MAKGGYRARKVLKTNTKRGVMLETWDKKRKIPKVPTNVPSVPGPSNEPQHEWTNDTDTINDFEGGGLSQADMLANLEMCETLTKPTKTQNDYLSEWVPRRERHLDILIRQEACVATSCMKCNHVFEGDRWRCKDCLGGRVLCTSCCKKIHDFQPLHRVEMWTGTHFRQAALWQTGVCLCLGHAGARCPVEPSQPQEPEQEFLPYPDEDTLGEVEQGEAEPAEYQEYFFQVPFKDSDPRIYPKAPPKDSNGNRFVTIVDKSGFHSLPLIKCRCPDHAPEDEQFLELGFFPASYKRVATVFTLDVLQDLRITSLECKTSAYRYYQKLRRITCPAFPHSTTNRYNELRRVFRQYRNLELWKVHGRGHYRPPLPPDVRSGDVEMQDERGPPGGEQEMPKLGLFCAACPQPGINLPDNWKEDENRNLYIRSLVGDGNFKAYQTQPKHEENDVHLTDGDAYMTARGPYAEHLEEATLNHKKYSKEKKKGTCHNYHAVADSEKAVAGKRCRGVGTWACARHGCFCIGSLVDFMKGERQMCMDWSLSEAIKNNYMEDIALLMGIYDVMCQFYPNVMQRFADSTKLSIPQTMRLIGAIGLFHVHGHKEECLYRWATTYIPGVGIIDGEILETLWSILNQISSTTVSATTAHRTETLDDHIGDSNWKKIIQMNLTLVAKFRRAVKERTNSEDYYQGTTERILGNRGGKKLIDKWSREVQEAERQRNDDVTAMDYMTNQIAKPLTRRQIEHRFLAEELERGHGTGVASWISQGLKIEETQYKLQFDIGNLGKSPSLAQCLAIQQRRSKLLNQINNFYAAAYNHLGEPCCDLITSLEVTLYDPNKNWEEDGEADGPREPQASHTPETLILPFPSGITSRLSSELDIEDQETVEELGRTELELRKGQIEESLGHVRDAVIHLSWHMKNKVRHVTGVANRTRSWGGVHILNRAWKIHRNVYLHNRKMMNRLLPDTDRPAFQIQYQYLSEADCSISTQITDPNSAGQSSRQMPWFWSTRRQAPVAEAVTGNKGKRKAPDDGRSSEDSDSNDSAAGDSEDEAGGEPDSHAVEFNRINWLAARAQRNRWAEEYQLVIHEMQWTVRYHQYMAQQWERRAAAVLTSPGHTAYAAKQTEMWAELARCAERTFIANCSAYTPLLLDV